VSAVSCSIGGQTAPVLYAGAQGELAGLDQINLGLPRNVAGRGLLNLALTVAGFPTNTVQINVQ
jgi:uncharacterized protein (TIGR03437 family)